MSLPENVLIVGVARDCAKTLPREVRRLAAAFDFVRNLHWLIIESDSSDHSPSVLSELGKSVPNFRALSLGTLRGSIPSRSDRIAHCRNRYLDEIRTWPGYSGIQYVVVSDLDGTNTLLTRAAVLSSFERRDWDVCCANQRGPYFDIWALRHPKWSPGDCLIELRQLKEAGTPEEAALHTAIFSKMIKIPVTQDWIEVDSAFGGLGIYRRMMLDGASYRGLSETNEPQCEHVSLHAAIRSHGGRIFINPALINCGYNRHSLEALPGAFLYRGALRIRRWVLDRISRR
jgi:hypothetical protein